LAPSNHKAQPENSKVMEEVVR